MNQKRLTRAVFVLSSAVAATASAQFHAPDTEYHDKAQRLFAVEAARVLAWTENQPGQSIWEVTYKVTDESAAIKSH